MSRDRKPNLLFVTPWTPRPTGSGPAMRAYYSLQALAENYHPHVLIAGVYEGGSPPRPAMQIEADYRRIEFSWLRDPRLAVRCLMYELAPATYFKRYGKPAEWRFATARSLSQAVRAFPGVSFDLIHVFRLYAAPYADRYRTSSPNAAMQLDLDDIESLTRERLASLCQANGDASMARRHERDAAEYRTIEESELRNWRRVFVSSEPDLHRLRDEWRTNCGELLPNVVQVGQLPARAALATFRFLFVGQLGYYPNVDAVRFFVREVWPKILEEAETEVFLDVVGAGAARSLIRDLEAARNVRFHGPAGDLRPFYDQAGAAVVPLRAGGGTRIKILEAFAEGVPVISTALGAEGIQAVAGTHLLVADAPADFADACLRLVRDRSLRQRLRENAHLLCRERYSPQTMGAVLARRTV